MNTLDRQTIDSFISYASQSMGQCVKEAENSVLVAGKILDIITTDVGRVSKMSDETIGILEGLKNSIESSTGISSQKPDSPVTNKNKRGVRDLILAMRGFSKNNTEIHGLLAPIVESLQFQDRVRQQMENVSKMFPTWIQMRSEIEAGAYSDQDSETTAAEFGARLLKSTVTPEERETIQAFIPNVKIEKIISADDDFFL
jgi:hypothetical protein